MLTSATSWIYARPDQLMAQAAKLAAGTTSSADTFNFVNSQVTKGGFGGGWSYGVGYVRDGFGIGAAFILDSLLYGQTLLGMTGDLTATLGFIGGLSLPFDILGVKVHVGGDVRPMVRIHAPITNSNAVSLVNALANGGDLAAALNSTTAYYGSGIGLRSGRHRGAGLVQLRALDTGPGWNPLPVQLQYIRRSDRRPRRGAFPAGGQVSDTYEIPMDIGVGISFHPDLGTVRYFVDPRISVDFRNMVGAFDGSAVVWTLLHAGVEVRLLNMFTLSGGVNQGYFTFGGGVKLIALTLNAAGIHTGARRAPGGSAELRHDFQRGHPNLRRTGSRRSRLTRSPRLCILLYSNSHIHGAPQ